MLTCSLVRDAAGPSDVEAAGAMRRRREVIPLRGGGFDQMAPPDRGECPAAAAWGGIRDTTDTSASSAGADYVLQLDQRFGAEQGERGARSAYRT
jgi:hypothetical protein